MFVQTGRILCLGYSKGWGGCESRVLCQIDNKSVFRRLRSCLWVQYLDFVVEQIGFVQETGGRSSGRWLCETG